MKKSLLFGIILYSAICLAVFPANAQNLGDILKGLQKAAKEGAPKQQSNQGNVTGTQTNNQPNNQGLATSQGSQNGTVNYCDAFQASDVIKRFNRFLSQFDDYQGIYAFGWLGDTVNSGRYILDTKEKFLLNAVEKSAIIDQYRRTGFSKTTIESCRVKLSGTDLDGIFDKLMPNSPLKKNSIKTERVMRDGKIVEVSTEQEAQLDPDLRYVGGYYKDQYNYKKLFSNHMFLVAFFDPDVAKVLEATGNDFLDEFEPRYAKKLDEVKGKKLAEEKKKIENAKASAKQDEEKQARLNKIAGGNWAAAKSCQEIAESLHIEMSGEVEALRANIEPDKKTRYTIVKLESWNKDNGIVKGLAKTSRIFGGIRQTPTTVWIKKEDVKVGVQLTIIGDYVDNRSTTLTDGSVVQGAVYNLKCAEPFSFF